MANTEMKRKYLTLVLEKQRSLVTIEAHIKDRFFLRDYFSCLSIILIQYC